MNWSEINPRHHLFLQMKRKKAIRLKKNEDEKVLIEKKIVPGIKIVEETERRGLVVMTTVIIVLFEDEDTYHWLKC
jgi:hypothetical protein